MSVYRSNSIRSFWMHANIIPGFLVKQHSLIPAVQRIIRTSLCPQLSSDVYYAQSVCQRLWGFCGFNHHTSTNRTHICPSRIDIRTVYTRPNLRCIHHLHFPNLGLLFLLVVGRKKILLANLKRCCVVCVVCFDCCKLESDEITK